MNIYIYGSKSFKKDVHDELDHSNIKFKLDASSAILDINKLDDLKYSIENNQDDIFLIDDAKIIKKDALNGKFKSKLKFLIPKDGIEEEYLFEQGVGDISFDSIDELSKHIINKIQEKNPQEDEELESDFDNVNEIHDSISDIVNDAYEQDDSIKLNDELSGLLISNESDFENEPEEVEDIRVEKYNAFDFDNELTDVENSKVDDSFEDLMNLDISNDDFEVKKNNLMDEESSFDEELENLDVTNEDFDATALKNSNNNLNIGNTQGDYEMAGDFSSLDDISENDIMAALNGEEVSISETQVLTSTNTSKQNDAVSINLSNTDDISELLSKLLKNKTLEITVKIKE